MIPYKEVKVLDLNTEAMGIPTIGLMENAGKALAEEIKAILGPGKNVLFLCGTGNNGGDGLVAARYLADHADVRVFILGKKMKTDISHQNFDALPDTVLFKHVVPGECASGENWKTVISEGIMDADLIVDSMLGVGITGNLREPFAFSAQEINDSGKHVVSVDVPTGLGGPVAVLPEITVTFHDTKPGMNGRIADDTGRIIESGNCGRIIIRDIGIPIEAEKFVGVGDFIHYSLPGKESHKGNNGNVLIVGGGPFTGAPALAATAALRTGSDLVFLAVPSRVHPIIASMSKDLIVHPLPSPDHLTPRDIPAILSHAMRAHVVLIGPGLGKHPETVRAIQELVKQLNKPMVIDADAIYSLKDVRFKNNVIFTPHQAEFRESMEDSNLMPYEPNTSLHHNRLFHELSQEEAKRTKMAMSYALTHGAILVQKGHQDLITDGRRFKFNNTGNPGMTVGGTGDVLSGIIASLYARGLERFNAGALGAYLCGRAGDLAFKDRWYSLLASDIIERIPDVFIEVIG
jgi:ADP-dependent NAD(P)H-hydrate dehydratase / NAD(P)H-hydrate epimerase